MTSLAQQLQRLAVPHTQVIFGEDKKRVSLLFDPKEAANLDREAVFAIGQCGIEELQNIDPKFTDFEDTLYNLASQNWERSLQSKEVNEQLDATIREFLIILSPYFPLKSSHKALEWLIYRYHIHQYNKDDLLLCVLPYHETKTFVRVLQLLNLQDPADKWNWLQPSAKNGVPLPRSTLINHCTKDPGFMAYILEIVPKFIKVHGAESPQLRAVLSLYTSCMLGALRRKENITERVLSIVIPHLTRGLKSKSVEYKAANYMVLSQLVVQVTLKEDLLMSLLPVLSKHISPSLTKEALSCLVLVYQNQALENLPKKTFKHLCKVSGIILLLRSLSQKYDVDGLMGVWVKRLLPAAVQKGDHGAYSSSDAGDELSPGRPQYASLLSGVLSEVVISEELRKWIAVNLLQELMDHRLNMVPSGEDEWKQNAKRLLHTLETRYPKIFDDTVQKLLKKVKGNQNSTGVLQEIMSLTTAHVKYQVVPETSTSLFLGLKHHSEAVRVLTVGHLADHLKQNQGESVEYIEDMLLERLQDDSAAVVEAVLAMGPTLQTVVSAEKLHPVLMRSVQQTAFNAKWSTVQKKALKLLCGQQTTDVTFDLLPYLVVYGDSEEAVGVAKVVLEKCSGELGNIIKSWRKEWLNTKKGVTKRNLILVTALVQYLTKHSPEEMMNKIKILTEKCEGFQVYKFLVIHVLCDLITKVKVTEKLAVFESLLRLLQPSIKFANEEVGAEGSPDLDEYNTYTLYPVWISVLVKNKAKVLPPGFIQWAALQLVESLEKSDIFDPSNPGLENKLAVLTMSLLNSLMVKSLTSHHKTWRHIVIFLIDKIMSFEVFMKLLCYIWSSVSSNAVSGDASNPVSGDASNPVSADASNPVSSDVDLDSSGAVSPVLHVGSFHLLRHVIATASSDDKARFFSAKQPVFACLLTMLLHSEKPVRCAVLDCLSVIQENCGDYLGPHASLIHKILKRREEIEADHMHTPHMLGKFFSKLQESPERTRTSFYKARRGEGLAICLRYIKASITSQTTTTPTRQALMAFTAQTPNELILADLLPLGSHIVTQCSENAETLPPGEITILGQILSRFDEELASGLQIKSPALVLLEAALRCGKSPRGTESPQKLALNQISRDFFKALPDVNVQRHIVSSVLNVTDINQNAIPQLHACLKQLKLTGSQVSHEFKAADSTEVATVKGKKRTRVSKAPESVNYPRLVLLLEVLQSRRKVKDTDELAAVLFPFLSRLVEGATEEETEYTKQLVLSCLLHLCDQWTDETKPQKQEIVNIEVLVHCTRSSPSPQTQQQAMLVMAALAPLYPEYLLHNVMSIFTFMGSTLLPQDDAYSFQIISKTIDTVIPALIKACSERSASVNETSLIQDIVRVFVDARHHIPKHRSLVLFKQLTGRVGVERHLWTVLVLMVECSVRMKDVPSVPDEVVDITEEGRPALDKELDLTANIASQFGASDQLRAASCILSFLSQLAEHLVQQQQQQGVSSAKKRGMKLASVPVLTIKSLNLRQLRLIQYHSTRLIVTMLARESFISQILQHSDSGTLSEELKNLFAEFVRNCLELLTKVTKGHGSSTNTNVIKFWKAILHKVYDILDKVKYLLPNREFLLVVSSLLDHDSLSIRRKALELLNTKLQTFTLDKLRQDEVESLLTVLPCLLNIATTGQKTKDTEADVTTVRQMSLFSLKLLCRLLGETHPKQFTEMFNVTLGILTSPDQSEPIIGSALLCVAELCANLKAQAIPYLTKFMPPLMQVLKDLDLLKRYELLLVCSLTALQKAVGSLPHFLSPYLPEILLAVCRLAPLVDQSDSARKSQPSIRLKAVRHQLATAVVPRVLVPVLSQVLAELIQNNQTGLLALYDISREHIETMTKEDLHVHQTALVSYFCDCLDLRTIKTKLSREAMVDIETRALDMILAMVMRLSENSFRPVFYKLFDWACRESSKKHKKRQITFFRLAQRLSEKLKGLFNLFIGHTVKEASGILDKNNSMHTDVSYFGENAAAVTRSCELLDYTMGCLHSCFLHDTEGLISKDIFTTLMQPLVDQLENMIGGESAYEERVTSHVTQCISQLAVASRDDSSWKSLNYQVLLKSRHSSPKVRFATLQVVEALGTKLGDEYMTLLPETAPFLAELMEDDSEEVEQKCQQVISSLEEILGESFQQYF